MSRKSKKKESSRGFLKYVILFVAVSVLLYLHFGFQESKIVWTAPAEPKRRRLPPIARPYIGDAPKKGQIAYTHQELDAKQGQHNQAGTARATEPLEQPKHAELIIPKIPGGPNKSSVSKDSGGKGSQPPSPAGDPVDDASLPPIDKDTVTETADSPKVPFIHKFPNGLKIGTRITISLKPLKENFEIMFEDDVNALLYMQYRRDEGRHGQFVLNTDIDGFWGSEQWIERPRFHSMGWDMEMRLVVGKEKDWIIQMKDKDGKFYEVAEFRGEMLHSVGQLKIVGDVELVSVSFTGLPKSTGDAIAVPKAIAALKNAPPFKMFIGILSAASYSGKRQAVRDSWFRYPQLQEGGHMVRFFIGETDNADIDKAIEKEQGQFGDLVKIKEHESYYTIAYKTMAMMQEATKIGGFDFVFKCDDDTYVNIDRLFPVVAGLQRQNLYWGHFSYKSGPIRDKNSKWHMSEKDYPDKHYPPFAHGPGYMVSADVASAISQAYEDGHLTVYRLEDVSMATWIDYLIKKKNMNIKLKASGKISLSSCHRGYYVAHYQSPDKLRCMYKKGGECC